MSKRGNLAVAAFAAGLLALPAGVPAASPPIVCDTEGLAHFVIVYRQSDYHPAEMTPAERAALGNKITPGLLSQLKVWLERSYQVEVVQHRFRAPWGRKIAGKVPVSLHDLGDPRRLGYVARADGILHLNIGAFDRKGTRPYNDGKPIMPCTVSHELFHAVQLAYDRQEERWLSEATAQWVETLAFPDIHDNVGHERVYLLYPFVSLHYPRTGKVLYQGRPYGGSVFFRFLSRHHSDGADIIRQIWHQCASVEGANTLQAVVKAVDPRSEGKLRDYFDRFAVGALLLGQAPANCRPVDAEFLRRANFTDLAGAWSRHYTNTFREPRTASLKLLFDEAEQSPNRPQDGRVSGLGTRYFKVPKLPDLPVGTTLVAVVKADEREVSLQGLANYGSGWSVFRAGRDSDSGSYVMHIPRADTMRSAAYVLLTRYSTDRGAKVYPMRLCVANPPVLVRAQVRQQTQAVLDTEWQDDRTETGVLRKRFKRERVKGEWEPARGETTVVLQFSQSVGAQHGKALCLLDGRQPVTLNSTDGGTRWTGSLPTTTAPTGTGRYLLINAEACPAGTQAAMPLDQDPCTAASIDFNRWQGYENSGDGMVVPLKEFEPTWFVVYSRRYRRGPVRCSIRLEPPREGDFRGLSGAPLWEQPYVVVAKLGPHVRYVYPPNVKTYGTRPKLWDLQGFDIPELQTSDLPDRMDLTAVFADGQRFAKTMAVEYEGQHDEYASNTWEWYMKYRRKYQAAWRMPNRTSHEQYERRAEIIYAGMSMLANTPSANEAKKVWDEVMRARPDQGQLLELAHDRLEGSGKRHEPHVHVEMLKYLRKTDLKPQAFEYFTTIKLLVNVTNDFGTARQVLEWYVQDKPALARSEPEWVREYEPRINYIRSLPKVGIRP